MSSSQLSTGNSHLTNGNWGVEGQRAVGRLMPRCCHVGAGTAVSGHFLTEH
ncbi:hypothetical protein J6590_081513 [Homalodisca vitripennis]|nr:hypothetical protein J6590_081513 [Homalodisca vitripennis]